MSAKYIITHIDGRLVSAEYDNNICVGLDILSPTGVMGNIYAGRVENVVKNINCAFVEIEKGVKCYFPLEADNNRHIFFNNKNNDKLNQGHLDDDSFTHSDTPTADNKGFTDRKICCIIIRYKRRKHFLKNKKRRDVQKGAVTFAGIFKY